jgi:hypothetical protein
MFGQKLKKSIKEIFMKKYQSNLLIILGMLIFNISVAAAVTLNINSLFSPFQNLNIGAFYLMNSEFVDAVVYLVLFLSLAQLVFTKVYSDARREAKMISVAVALALTFAMTVLEMRTGFYLGQLYPVALLVFLLVLAMLLYNLLLGLFNGEDGKTVSAALTFLVLYGLLVVPFGALYKWIQTNAPLLSGVLSIASIIAFFYLLMKLFKILGLGGSKTPPRVYDPYESPRPEPRPPEPTPPRPRPSGENSVVIDSPKSRGYKPTDTIPIRFTVSGPDHTPRGYGAIIQVSNSRGKSVIQFDDKCHDMEHTAREPIKPGLPRGEYTITVVTHSEQRQLAEAHKNFVIDNGERGPRVEIIKPKNMPPFNQNDQIPLKFKTYDISLPYEFEYVVVNTATKNKSNSSKGNANKDEHTIADINNPKLSAGKYVLLLGVTDIQTNKKYQDAVEFEVKGDGQNIAIEIVRPSKDEPDPDAVRLTGDTNPIIIKGTIAGTNSNYDHIWGIYTSKGNLVVKLACIPNVPSGAATNGPLDTTKAPLMNNTLDQIPPGKYNLILFAQIPKSRNVEAPTQLTNSPPSGIVRFAVRKIEILSKQKPKPRGHAEFSVIVGGKDFKSGKTYTTEMKVDEKSLIKIRNSGDGGNLVWRAASDPWMKVIPTGSRNPLKKHKEEEVIIEFDMSRLASLRTDKVNYGRVLIEGAYGTKISPDEWKTGAGKCLINFELKF